MQALALPELPVNASNWGHGQSRGLECLCFAAGLHQIAADPVQMSQALGFGEKTIGLKEILLAAKNLQINARAAVTRWERLSRVGLPLIAELNSQERNGQYIVITRIQEDKAIIFDPLQPQRPRILGRAALESEWSGRVILLRPSFTTNNSNQKFGISWFIPSILKYRNIFLEVFAAAFVIQIFALATPLFSQVIIDKVLMHRNLSTLHVLASGMLIIILFEGILSVLQTHLLAHTSNRIDVVLGAKLVQHMLRLPLRYFEMRRVGDTVARVRELENIRQFITGSSISTFLDLIFIIVFIAVMFYYSVTLTWVTLAALPFFIGLSLLMRPLMRTRLNDKFDRGAESQSYLVEAVTGIHTIKALAIEPIMQRKWETVLARYVSASFRATHLGGIGGAISQVIQKLSTLTILWVGAQLVLDGQLSVGQLIAFQMLSGRAINPIVRVVQLWQDFQQVGLSVERLADLMNAPSEPLLNPNKASLPAIRGRVTLQDVHFRYLSDAPTVLKGLSFEIAAGKTIGIVGRSGSGKSTLAKLLQRLYLPETGSINIDGIDIRQVDPSWLRRQIGVVLQENFLFSGSIRENISIHMPGAPMQLISHVATLAGAHEFISTLSDGYDSQVGERGTALSGGQRQRVTIARALLNNPRILIFDEATSALDYESERIIQNNLAQICKGRTVFIIAHRLSTIRKADTILVLDKGALVEQGTHDQLMQKKTLYHHLFSQQELHVEQ